jgi:hypothetical protein
LITRPDEGEAENLPVLRFRGSSVLGRPNAQPADEIVIQIANGKGCQIESPCRQPLQ